MSVGDRTFVYVSFYLLLPPGTYVLKDFIHQTYRVYLLFINAYLFIFIKQ